MIVKKKFWYDYSFGLLTKVFASIPSDLTELRYLCKIPRTEFKSHMYVIDILSR